MVTPLPLLNTLSGIVSPRRQALLGLASGLVSGDNWGDALGTGFARAAEGSRYDDAYATSKKEEAERQRQIQMTADYLRQQGATDWADRISQGIVDPQTAFNTWYKETNPKAGQDETFFGTPVPYQTEGGVQYGQLGNQGTFQPIPLPEGATFAPRTSQVDLGNFISVQDQFGNELYRMPKSGGVPTGFQQTGEGTIAPMPGSEPERERKGQEVKASSAMNALETKSQVALNAVDKALQQVSWATSGMASISAGVPGTPAHDLAKTLQTIMANIGFEELQTMRDNSPTGGALGQVSERELAFLQSTITNIQQSQSEQQLRENLQILREYLASSRERRRAAYQQEFGDKRQPSGNQTSTGIQWSIEP